jgi:predicted ABC-type ATPase
VYQPAVDSWQVYDNSDFTMPRLVASGMAGNDPLIADLNRWHQLQASR